MRRNFKAAIEIYQNLLDVDPSNQGFRKNLHYQIGKICYDSEHNLRSTISSTTEALKIDTTFHEARMLRSKAYIELKMTKDFLADCEVLQRSSFKEEVLKLKTEVVDIQAEEKNNTGRKEYLEKRYDAAIKSYSDAIAINPKNSIYYSNRSASYMKTCSYELAVADALKSIEIDPKYWKGCSRAVNCFLALGNIKMAGVHIDKFKTIVNGVNLMDFNETPKLERLKQLDASITRAYDQQDFQKCLKNLEDALKIATFSTNYRDLKVECLVMLEKTKEADEIIDAVLSREPRNSNIIFLQGLSFYQRGELEDSIKKFETALKMDKDSRRIQKNRQNAKQICELYKKGESAVLLKI